MRHLALAFGLLILVAVAACATPPVRGDFPRSTPWERGRFYASRSCAGCHAVTDQGASPNPRSPPFRTLPSRFDAKQLAAALAAISRHGHGNMPPIYVAPAEIRDIVRYVESLAPPGDAPPPAAKTTGLITRNAGLD